MVRRFIIFLLLFMSASVLFGQRKITCTGHVSAEIIEGVAVSPSMATAILLNNLSEDMNLGSVRFTSDEDIACNVILNSGDLENSGGVIAFYDIPNEYDSEKILRFSASAKNLREQKNGIYKGSYSVMLMYE
ncbi:MAG TPA: hypothetical protein P5167_05260 [Bacteroidales bacterium]|nr:hypothetical protein [Bacteroidales bacterium]